MAIKRIRAYIIKRPKLLYLLGFIVIGLNICLYPYSYWYTAGYYDMNLWSKPDTETNLTIGLFILMLAMGGVLGYFIPKKMFKAPPKTPKARLIRSMVTATCVAILMIAYCFILAKAGVPGFRLW